jgi:predicted ATP-grasp superfamily ATP-dependent carboligase
MNTAIVTYGRGWPALSVVRSLGQRGVRVICGDSVPMAPSGFSKHCAKRFRYPDPRKDPEGFLSALENTARKALKDGGDVVLIPVHSETYLIAEHRERFERLGVRLSLPDFADIELTHDKGRLAKLAVELGLPIPVTHHFDSLADVYARAHEINYPAFVKVRGSAAGVGIEKVDGPQELIAVYTRFVEGYELAAADYPLVQEFVAGNDYCLSALFDHGKCVAIHTYRNIRQFPRTTGAGVLRETVQAPVAEEVAIKLLSHLEWHGMAQLDFRWDEDPSDPKLIELNPRFFGGLPQAVAAGVDYPWLVYQQALGQPVEQPVIDATVRTESPVLGLLATVDAARRDGDLLGKLKLHKGTKNDVLSWSDPLPALGAFYPLFVALEQGTLSTAAILSEEQIKVARVARKGLRGHLKPSVRTLMAAALVFLVSVFFTTWAVTDGTVVDLAFSLPERLSTSLAPAGGGLGYGVFHMANFCFVYMLGAMGLKVHEDIKVARIETQA